MLTRAIPRAHSPFQLEQAHANPSETAGTSKKDEKETKTLTKLTELRRAAPQFHYFRDCVRAFFVFFGCACGLDRAGAGLLELKK